jgi:outer membrane protein assembly factor BamB
MTALGMLPRCGTAHVGRSSAGWSSRSLGWTLVLGTVATALAVLMSGVGGAGSVMKPWSGAQTARLLPSVVNCGGSDWPTYLGETSRDGNNLGETALSPTSAPGLVPLWNYSTGAPVSASPAIVKGVAYIGSWNGYEYALNASTGHRIWKTFLGTDPFGARPIGIASSATVQNGFVYVGGGNSSWYALHANNGSVAWNVTTGNISHGYFNWASPLIANGYAYIGLASRGDHPLVYAGLLQVSLRTHAVVHFFNTTANGTIGASIWTTPALNTATNTVFVTTGNGGLNGSIYADSVLAFNGTTLRLKGNWSIPSSQTVYDGDFGATPALFTTAAGVRTVVASDKNGIVYAWNQSDLRAGPIWQNRLALPSNNTSNPNLGPVSFHGGDVFVGTSTTHFGGVTYSGSVSALSAVTGKVLWRDPENGGPVLGAPVYANGVLVVGSGSLLQVLNASNGHVLYSFHVSTGKFEGPAAISHGEIVIGADDGTVHAFGVTSCAPGFWESSGATPTPSSGGSVPSPPNGRVDL